MATHSWRLNRVKNNYAASVSTTVINNVVEATDSGVEVLSAESTQTLVSDSITALQTTINTQITSIQADLTTLTTAFINLQTAP